MDQKKFPFIRLSGTPSEIGLQHGKLLKNRIIKTIDYYRRVFKFDQSKVLEQAAHFREQIAELSQDYMREIEGIAKGATVNPLWIYALNARTEILRNANIFMSECTALYFS
ncbi:MAG: C45 family autoproteolytic acyltransferase/hydrolase, partial [Candidatus Kariarchaeaceae archaeon]